MKAPIAEIPTTASRDVNQQSGMPNLFLCICHQRIEPGQELLAGRVKLMMVSTAYPRVGLSAIF
jgi:hypothetical protein